MEKLKVKTVDGGVCSAKGFRAAAAAAALCLLSDLILALAEELRRPRRVRTRRWTRILVGFGGAIVKKFMRLWLLPWEAWVCLSAASAALWRMAVSHRRLLEWETAAQSEARRGGLGAGAERGDGKNALRP